MFVQALVHQYGMLYRPDFLSLFVDLCLDEPDMISLKAVLPVGKD